MRGEDVGRAVQRPVRPVRQRLEEGIQRRNLLRRLRIRDPSRNLSTNKTRRHHSNCAYEGIEINLPGGVLCGDFDASTELRLNTRTFRLRPGHRVA